ncbi:MAG: RING finger protein [Armatimonadota bacterium]
MSLPSHVGKTCPCCSAPIKPDSRVVLCPACQVAHHVDCWRHNNGCATFGCRQTPGAQPPPPRQVAGRPQAAINLKPQEEPPPAPLVPVWAPNPGVPLTARLLAYTFAGFMLLALLLAIVTKRPPDVPPLPEDNQWETYTVDSQFTIQYPTGWIVDKEQDEEETDLVCKLWQNSPVNVIIAVQPLPASFDPASTESIRARLDARISENYSENNSENYSDYQAEDRYADSNGTVNWQRFGFCDEKIRMTGSWTTFVKDRYHIIIIGECPLDGRTVMESILSTMAESVSIIDNKPQAAGNG